MAEFLKLGKGSKLDLIKGLPEYQSGAYVYFLFFEERLVYVGTTATLSARIERHKLESSKRFDEVRYMKVSHEKAAEIERIMIQIFTPPLNVQHNEKAK